MNIDRRPTSLRRPRCPAAFVGPRAQQSSRQYLIWRAPRPMGAASARNDGPAPARADRASGWPAPALSLIRVRNVPAASPSLRARTLLKQTLAALKQTLAVAPLELRSPSQDGDPPGHWRPAAALLVAVGRLVRVVAGHLVFPFLALFLASRGFGVAAVGRLVSLRRGHAAVGACRRLVGRSRGTPPGAQVYGLLHWGRNIGTAVSFVLGGLLQPSVSSWARRRDPAVRAGSGRPAPRPRSWWRPATWRYARRWAAA
jgi:hypothetical protein